MKAEVEQLYALSLASKGLDVTPKRVISKAKKRPHYAQSDAQKRLWLIDNLDPGNAAYNMPCAFRITTALDIDLLESSFNAVVERHEILRTVFDEIDEEPVQIVRESLPISVRRVEITTEESAERESSLQQVINREAQQPFDLREGPLLRVTAVQLGEEEHVVLIVLHHIVGDANSFEVLLSEVSAFYDALTKGETVSLEPMALQYVDYSEWMKGSLAGDKKDEQVGFWKGYLEGAPNTLNLPVDYPRHLERTQAGASKHVALPAELSERIHTVARQTGSTVFMLCLAAFKALMFRYTNSEDVVVGTPVSNRNREELKPLIGFFVNTLALRSDLSGDPSFGELVERVRESTLAAFAHQELPFDYLVEQIDVKRHSTAVPLINTMFSYSQQGEGMMPDEMEPVGVEVSTSKFDLSMEVGAKGPCLSLTVEYATDLFEGATIEFFIQHYIRLLSHGLRQLDTPLSQLEVQGEVEHKKIVDEWSRGPEVALPEASIRDQLRAQLQRRGSAVAAVDADGEMSYDQLHARVRRISHQLLSAGVGKGDVVAVCMDRSNELIASMAAVLDCGAAFLMLDIRYPQDRLGYMVQDAGASIVLGRQKDRESVPPAVRERCLYVDEASGASGEMMHPTGTLAGSDLAYVVYTSGSSGKPKGVEITHDGLANLISWHRNAFKVTPSDRASQILGVSFDAFVLDTLPYLCSGASIHFVDQDTRVDPSALVRWLDEQKISIGVIPTPLMESMFDEAWPKCAALRVLLTGGDTLHRKPPKALPCKLYNLYGPAESTVVSTCKEVSPFISIGIKPTIGRPIQNHRAFVLDSHQKLVSAGVVGELYVGGPGIARGYRNNPAQTAHAFVDVAIPGEAQPLRLYRTGDQAKLLTNGDIDFIGRVDRQVNIRGFRIELAEVEANLFEFMGVGRAAVVPCEPLGGDKSNAQLIAFIEPTEGQRISVPEVRDFLRDRLPAFALPTTYHIVSKLPVTANGKIDYDALEAPDVSRTESQSMPLSPTEEIISGIWCSMLKMERIGIEDNFFSLGGHSLLVARTTTRINKVLKVDMPLKAIFDEPTVAALARSIDANKWGGKGTKVPPLKTRSEREDGPHRADTSFPQQRLLFLELLDPQTSTYNVPIAHKIEGELNLRALQFAFDQLIARHEILRTVFGLDENFLYYQEISPPSTVHIVQTSLRAVPEDQKDEHVQLLLDEHANQPFDLLKGPLFRVNLVETSEHTHVLLMNMHHIITDGLSIEILYRELSEFYGAFCEGRAASLKPLAYQYADFAQWQTRWLRFGALIALRKYWETALTDAPAEISLPLDRARRPNQSLKGDVVNFSIDKNLRKRLRAIANENHVTLFMLLLGAFNVFLSKYSGQTDVVVGTPTANRKLEDLENLIGFFVNMLPMRTDLSGNPTFRALLERVREMALGAYEHQDLPFEQIVEQVSEETRWHRSPIFQVAFVLQQAQEEGVKLAGMELEPVGVENKTSKMDLTLAMQEVGDCIEATFEYNVDLFDRTTVVRMTAHFESVLRQLVANIDCELSDVQLVSAQEREVIERDWSQGALVEGDLTDACTAFEQHAVSNPNAPALNDGTATLSYGELDQEANRLANYLVSRGVQSDDVIAVALPRSVSMISSELAIWKAGAAFINLDLEHPTSRLAHILKTAAVKKVITISDVLDHLPKEIQGACELVLLDSLGEALTSAPTVKPDVSRLAGSVAYVNSTSGSTGVPKCVEVTHGNVANLNHAMQSVLEISAQDKASQLAGPSFDAMVFEVWPYLTAGASVQVIAANVAKLPEHLIDTLAKQQVTVAFIPTAMLEVCLSLPWPKEIALTRVKTGGAALKKYPPPGLPFSVYNMYGPTENTVASTYAKVPELGHLDGRAALPSIGKPLPGVQAYLLDDGLNPVPEGVVGEIYLGGASLARGYRNASEQTAQAFVASPFDREQRLYKTGDRARYRDGELDFQGRLDDQVNLRGYRIELGEIAAAILESPHVEEAFVTVSDANGTQALVAYVTGKPKQAVCEDHVLIALKSRLPAYMLPTAVMVLDTLPKNSNGKVEASNLPAPDTAPRAHVPQVPIVEEMDRQLAKIWSEVLNYQPTSLAEDFFEHGGHSMLALTLKAEIRKAFGVEIKLTELFEDATLQHLSKLVRESDQVFDTQAEYFRLPETPSREKSASFLHKFRQFVQAAPNRILVKAPRWRPKPNRSDLLVPLQAEGHGPTVYCVHAISGVVTPYREFANALGPSHPVYGLQLSERESQPNPSVEDLAEQYAEAIRGRDARGPIALVGWSFGGVLAFEMASHLRALSVEVANLTLIDSFPCSADMKGDRPDGQQLLVEFLSDLALSSGEVDLVASDLQTLNELPEGADLAQGVQKLIAHRLLPDGFPLEEAAQKWGVYQRGFEAWSTYTPQPYHGEVNLIAAAQEFSDQRPTPLKAWGKYAAGGLSIDVVPATHYSVMRGEHAVFLADTVRTALLPQQEIEVQS